MEFLLIAVICLLSSIIGALCGIGGDVVIMFICVYNFFQYI